MKLEKEMQKIGDAERHRRTPQISATGGKDAEGEKSAGIGRHRRRRHVCSLQKQERGLQTPSRPARRA